MDSYDYVKYTHEEKIQSIQKVVDDLEVEGGDIRTALVHYHYSEEIPGDYMQPSDPASVEIISILELLAIPEDLIGVLLYQGEYSLGRTLYALDGTDIVSPKAFKDLELHLLEGGI